MQLSMRFTHKFITTSKSLYKLFYFCHLNPKKFQMITMHGLNQVLSYN